GPDSDSSAAAGSNPAYAVRQVIAWMRTISSTSSRVAGRTAARTITPEYPTSASPETVGARCQTARDADDHRRRREAGRPRGPGRCRSAPVRSGPPPAARRPDRPAAAAPARLGERGRPGALHARVQPPRRVPAPVARRGGLGALREAAAAARRVLG